MELNNKEYINALLKRMHNNDIDAANELYETIKLPLTSHIYKQIHDRDVTEDILHDVFLILLKRVKKTIFFFNGFGYIFKIAQREIQHYYKKLKNNNNDIDDSEIENIPGKKDLQEELEFKILFNSLSKEEKEYVSLRAHGFTLVEIADKMQVSLSTVKRKFNTIIIKLKRGYDEKENN